jgi:hypothetical protein
MPTICKRLRSAWQAACRAEKGTNFDVTWAESDEWRVVSPFVEFAWRIDEPLYDKPGFPRVLQVQELLGHLMDGIVPTEPLVPLIEEMRNEEL